MKTYEDLGIPNEIESLLESKATEPGFEMFMTPAGLKKWLDQGNGLSDAVSGIGPRYEEIVLTALMQLEDSREQADDGPKNTGVVKPEEPKAETPTKQKTKPKAKKPNDSKPDAPAPKAKKELPIVHVTLNLPLGELPDGYERQQAEGGKLSMSQRSGTHLQVQLKPHEAETFLRIREGLRATNAKLDDGRPVWTNPDVLRYVMAAVSA